jgi:NADPH-dependent 2,4-dienoyl-CoA reductase/sulfur reductase-like enzyme/rhodanese-related sulfurtransferase
MTRRIVVIGGVGAGASAAVRARRLDEQAEIVIFERGGYISFANCGLPYYVGKIITDRNKLLVEKPDVIRKRFRIDVRVNHEVTTIDRANRRVQVTDHTSGTTTWESYDRLILCPGAHPLVPPIAGADAANVFVLHNMEHTDAVFGYLEENAVRSVAVIGAGYIGLEVAEALVHRGLHVNVVEMLDQVLAPLDADMAGMVHQHIRAKGVGLHLGNGLASLKVEGDRVTRVGLQDGTELEADMVVMSVGVRPNSKLAAEAGLEIGERRGIRVNEHLQTSDPDILAAGDAIEVIHGVTGRPCLIALAAPANKHGRQAGEMSVTGTSRPAARVMGTAIVKVFDLAVGITGLSVKAANAEGIDARHVVVQRPNHATYYPGAQPMVMKLVYRGSDRRLLGVQIVGGAGVDRRIDVVATALHFGGTIDDLAELDLAYAPPYGAAKDPVNIAAFAAQNVEAGLVRNLDPAEVPDSVARGGQLVDVRTPKEFAKGTIPGAVNIPLEELRERSSEVADDRPILTFCKVGQRGYVAARILANLGRTEVLNVAGGYDWYVSQQA